MPWTPPTIEQFDALYPQFNELPNAQVEYELVRAIEEVSAGDWIDRDRTPAVLNLTAHRLLANASGSGVSGGAGGSGTPPGAVLKARNVGDVRSEFEYGRGAPGTVDYSDLATSSFGQQYLNLKRLNFPAFRVV